MYKTSLDQIIVIANSIIRHPPIVMGTHIFRVVVSNLPALFKRSQRK